MDEVLSPDQAGFNSNGGTADQVAALTTYTKNGYQQKLKTGAVFLDLAVAYDTIINIIKSKSNLCILL